MFRTLRARLRVLTTALSTSRAARRIGTAAMSTATVALILSVPAAAYADPGAPVILAANDLPTVINNLQTWPRTSPACPRCRR